MGTLDIVAGKGKALCAFVGGPGHGRVFFIPKESDIYRWPIGQCTAFLHCIAPGIYCYKIHPTKWASARIAMVDGGDPDSSVFFFARGPREIACLVLDGPLTDHEPHVADMIIAEGWRELGKD